MEIDLSHATRLLYGNPVMLLSSRLEGQFNVMPVTWVTPLSVHPPLVGVSIAPSSWTFRFVSRSGEFVLNVPDLGILDIVHACGTHSGRELNKIRAYELATESSRMVKPLNLIDCIGTLECEVRDMQRIGDRAFFIAEIVYASADDDRFGKRWRPDAYTLHYLGGHTYLSNGKIYVPKRAKPIQKDPSEPGLFEE